MNRRRPTTHPAADVLLLLCGLILAWSLAPEVLHVITEVRK